jgi:RNA polymerase sigma-70 factor, ECF subfamily
VNDSELSLRLRLGEATAFAELMTRHQRLVYGYLRARVMQRSDADDLTQEVFLRCYEARARFDTGALIQPWLLGIARNLLREWARQHRRRREVAWTELCLELEESPVPDVAADPALEALPECLAQLGPSAREAIELHYRGDHRLAEIAAWQHRSEGAVKLLLHRARQALRDCLTRARRKVEHS